MKNYLVTGATGYVGSEIVDQLIKSGRIVTALGRTEPKEKIEFIKADITDFEQLSQRLNNEKFDCIMHIASLPGDTGNPGQMMKVNVDGCFNLLEMAKKIGVKRFMLASSVSAYEWYPATKFNPPDYMPVDEEHPCRPKDMYSTTKRIQELLAITYYEQFKLPVSILRLTAVVGPKGKGGGRGYFEIARQLKEGKAVKIPHFTAEEMCHYVDIRDVARMFIEISENSAAAGEIFNCCGPKAVTGSEFASIVNKIIPEIKVEFGFPWSQAQGGKISFDMSKAKKIAGFEPIYSLEDSIRNIIEWANSVDFDEEDTEKQEFGSGVKK